MNFQKERAVNSFKKYSQVIGSVVLLCAICIACGRRTPPQPVESVDSFRNLKVIQRGEHVRLSWVMKHTIPSARKKEQFLIEEYILKHACPECALVPVRHFRFLFPSNNFIIKGKQVYFYLPQPQKDLYVHIFKVYHQNADEQNLGKVQAARFTRFVEFPSPPGLNIESVTIDQLAQIQTLVTPGRFKGLRNFQLMKLTWKTKLEKAELTLSSTGDMLRRKVFYRVNLYKTVQGIPWPEKPFNPVPLKEAFYIDYQKQDENIYLYRLRLVDSYGNESPPSIALAVKASKNISTTGEEQ